VPPPALRTVRAVARRWPAARGAGFEIRLGGDAPRAAVDFGLCVGSAPGEREACARGLEQMGPAPGSATERLAAAMAEWADRSTPLGRIANLIWFEFDLAGGRDAVCPSPFFAERRSTYKPLAPPVAERPAINLVFEALAGAPPADRAARTLDRCLASLPPGAGIRIFGVWIARVGAAIHLAVHGIRSGAIADYLRTVDWDGDRVAVAQAEALLTPFADSLVLTLDVGDDGMQPRVGLELRLARQPTEEPRWDSLLARLVERGLCGPERRGAVLAWPGVRLAPPALDAPHLAAQRALLGPRAVPIVRRKISHAKLVVRGDGSLEAKAYCTFGFRAAVRRGVT
jgi:hypothetical protein